MYILVRKFRFSTLCPMPSPSVGVPTLWGQQFAKYYDHLFFRSGGKIFQIVQRNKFSCLLTATLFEQDCCSKRVAFSQHENLFLWTSWKIDLRDVFNNVALQWKPMKKTILISKGFCFPTSCLPKMTVTDLTSSPFWKY